VYIYHELLQAQKTEMSDAMPRLGEYEENNGLRYTAPQAYFTMSKSKQKQTM
jgi:hypothetical protein